MLHAGQFELVQAAERYLAMLPVLWTLLLSSDRDDFERQFLGQDSVHECV